MFRAGRQGGPSKHLEMLRLDRFLRVHELMAQFRVSGYDCHHRGLISLEGSTSSLGFRHGVTKTDVNLKDSRGQKCGPGIRSQSEAERDGSREPEAEKGTNLFVSRQDEA